MVGMRFGFPEMLVVLLIVLLIFGANRDDATLLPDAHFSDAGARHATTAP